MSEINGQPPLPVKAGQQPLATLAQQSALDTFEPPDSADVDLREYLRIFLRRKWTVIACVVAVFGASLVYTVTTPRVYEATATFLVNDPKGPMQNTLESQLPAMAAAISAPALETHAALLQGQSTAEETAAWLETHGGPRLSAGAIRGSIRTSIVPKTQLVQLKARAGSSGDAEKIANTTAQCYVTMNRRLAQGSSDSASRYLTEQLALSQSNLTESEGALRGFKESTRTVAEDAEAKELLDRAVSLRTDIDKTKADLAQAQERLSTVRSQLLMQNKSISAREVRDNAVVQQLRARLVDLEGQRLTAEAKYTSAFSAPIEQLDSQIRVVKDQLSREIGNVVRKGGGDLAMQQVLTGQLSQGEVETASLTARVRQLQRGLNAADSQLRAVPARQIALARVQRRVEIAQTIYSDLLKRSQEIEVGRVMALGNAILVEQARAPRLPVRPRVPLNLALGLILGLGLGIGLALVQEQLDDSIRDEDEILRLTGAPVLGAVPVLQQDQMVAMISRSRAQRRGIEAYTGLRYNLGFVMPGPGGHTVLVTSAGPQEGKTTTAANLAVAAALAGRRVILVDADLRRPAMHRLFSLDGARGLTDAIVGGAAISPSPVRIGDDDIDLKVMGSGSRPPNPTDLLDSNRMRALLQELRQQADLIILDSPPVLSAADSLVLAGMSDAVLLVCIPGESHRRALKRTSELLNTVGARISGVVLNKLQPRAGYGYYGYYYYSSYYGQYGQAEEQRPADADSGDDGGK